MHLWLAGDLYSQATEDKSNLQFIEGILRTFADSLLRQPPFASTQRIGIEVLPRVQQQQAAAFVRDVFVAAAVESGKSVKILAQIEQKDHANPEPAGLLLKVYLEGWNFSIEAAGPELKKQKYLQSFQGALRYIVTDQRQVIHLAGKKTLQGARGIADDRQLARVQKNQPDFASATLNVNLSKKDVLQSLLIVAATAATVFLIYHYRSQ